MFEIDKNVPIPIYYQLKELIKKKIKDGEFKPGDRLPTEQELCEIFSISRTPVGKALTELSYEGIIYRRPRLGTFISDFSLYPSRDVMRLKVMIPEEKWAITLQKDARIWNEQNRDRQVKLDLLLVGHPEFRFKIGSAVASGNAPDFSLIDSVWVAQFAKDRFLIPLDEIDPEWANNDYKQDFFPVFVKETVSSMVIFMPSIPRQIWPLSGSAKTGSRQKVWNNRQPGMSLQVWRSTFNVPNFEKSMDLVPMLWPSRPGLRLGRRLLTNCCHFYGPQVETCLVMEE